MDVYVTLVVVATYIFFVWVARKIAMNKGLNPTPYFALALFLTPLVGIIAALVAQPKTAVTSSHREPGKSG
jgi:hydrogenase-4 membrane subunit HyfE